VGTFGAKDGLMIFRLDYSRKPIIKRHVVRISEIHSPPRQILSFVVGVGRFAMAVFRCSVSQPRDNFCGGHALVSACEAQF
jgi:hypothetical protein